MHGRTAYPNRKISETFLNFAAPVVRDLVDRPLPAPLVLRPGGGPAESQQPLGLLVEVALRARVGVAEAAGRLLGELVSAPRSQGEEAEEGVAAGRRARRHALENTPVLS